MEAKKWVNGTKGVLILVILSLVAGTLMIMQVDDHYQDFQQQQKHHQQLLTGDLKDSTEKRSQLRYISVASEWVKNIIFNGFLGARGEIWHRNSEMMRNNETRECIDVSYSFAVPGKPLIVNCCPPKPESEEAVIDFELPPPSALRVRRPAHLVDDEYIAKYKKAVAIMKSLPNTDPRSFQRQANMHRLYCTGSYNQKYSKTINVDIHNTWYFFPWHRMMIYFHEKILASLIGDENFTLPFWQWDTPDGMAMPKMYMEEPLFDVERDVSHFPPHLGDLSFDRRKNETKIDDAAMISKNLAFMYNQMVSAAQTSELFMGCPFKVGEAGFCLMPGTMEIAPHDTMHSWVGSNKNPDREDMGVFYSAARDPSFYAHHTNIDRLWDVWREMADYKKDIVDPDWLNAYFYFHNEKSELVRVRVHQIMNITKMGYRYQKVDLPWLNVKPKPSVPPKTARNKLKMYMKNAADQELNNMPQNATTNSIENSCFEPNGRTLDTNVRVRVHRPKAGRSKEDEGKEEEVLVVYGIHVKKDMYLKFDVYINLVPDDDDDDINLGPESREFAGIYVNLRHGVTKNMNEVNKRKSHLKLGISELLEDLEADEDDSILVTLVPRSESLEIYRNSVVRVLVL
ncbi:hypothetical protein MKW92_033151 [Papaver armeniacum]|nr:hypothetical protein MKW92_033151 [Papaver armeniacum]